jgi:DNA-binding MarR family transcriptional regulator
MREIAKRIGRDKSTVTALIKKLIDIGYVEKRQDPTDNRITLIKLTKAGRTLKQGFDEISESLLAKVYRGFSEKEKEVIIHGLEKINKNL